MKLDHIVSTCWKPNNIQHNVLTIPHKSTNTRKVHFAQQALNGSLRQLSIKLCIFIAFVFWTRTCMKFWSECSAKLDRASDLGRYAAAQKNNLSRHFQEAEPSGQNLPKYVSIITGLVRTWQHAGFKSNTCEGRWILAVLSGIKEVWFYSDAAQVMFTRTFSNVLEGHPHARFSSLSLKLKGLLLVPERVACLYWPHSISPSSFMEIQWQGWKPNRYMLRSGLTTEEIHHGVMADRGA